MTGLDQLDRQIVALLQKNGRLANQEIGRQLGVTEGTVRKRLERLLAEGWIRVMAVAD
ncbi:MAG: Lrp/AsnC family transcriptional regulator, partial [Chloroflexota bacterium]